jgi:RecA/RadA recombinase
MQLAGDEGAGKTSFLLSLCRLFMDAGGLVCYMETENALHDIQVASYLGPYADQFFDCLYNPESIEEATEMLDFWFGKVVPEFDPEGIAPKIIVYDTLAGVQSEKEADDLGAVTRVGGISGEISSFLRKMKSRLVENSALLCLGNQVRDRIETERRGGFTPARSWYDSVKVPGGRAVKFYATYDMIIRKRGKVKSSDKTEIVGHTSEIVFKKNKIDVPFKNVIFDVLYGKEISYAEEAVKWLARTKRFGIESFKSARKMYFSETLGVPREEAAPLEEFYRRINSPGHIEIMQREFGIKFPARDRIFFPAGHETVEFEPFDLKRNNGEKQEE